MRECKHEFEWYRDDTSRCRGCGIVVPDKIATLIDAEDNFRLPAREWIEEVLEERDELQAQVAEAVS